MRRISLVVLAALALACHSSTEETVNKPPPPVPTTPTVPGLGDLRLTSYPVTQAIAGLEWSYHPTVSQGGDTHWSLVEKPQGATVDATGAVHWTPPAGASGRYDFNLYAVQKGYQGHQHFTLTVSHPVVQAAASASASSGAAVSVSAPTSPIYGSAVTVPPGAITSSAAVNITIAAVDNAPVPPSASISGVAATDLRPVEFGPTGLTFSQPVNIVVPVSAAVLAAGSPDVQTFDYASGSWQKVPVVSVDTVNHLVVAQVNHFSTYVATPSVPTFSLSLNTGASASACANGLVVRAPLALTFDQIPANAVNGYNGGAAHLSDVLGQLAVGQAVQVYSQLVAQTTDGTGSQQGWTLASAAKLADGNFQVSVSSDSHSSAYLAIPAEVAQTDVEGWLNGSRADEVFSGLGGGLATGVKVTATASLYLVSSADAAHVPAVAATALGSDWVATSSLSALASYDDDCDGAPNSFDPNPNGDPPPALFSQDSSVVVTAGTSRTLAVSFAGAAPTFVWSSSDPSLTVTPAPSGTSANIVGSAPGFYTVTVVATRGTGTAAWSWKVNVVSAQAPNTAPSVALFASANTVHVGESVSLTAVGQDLEQPASQLSYHWASSPAGVLSTLAGSNVVFNAAAPGTYDVSVTANDGLTDSVATHVPITVLAANVNRAPYTPSVTPTTVTVTHSGQAPVTVNLNVLAADPDGDLVTVDFAAGASNPAGGSVLVSGNTATFTGVLDGTYTYFVTATDPASAVSSAAVVKIIVAQPAAPPDAGTADGGTTPDAGSTQFTLAVGQTGFGTITGAGINCSSGNGTCFVSIARGTQVSLTATPAAGGTFLRWTAGPCTGSANPVCTFAIAANTNVTASFSVPDSGSGGADGGVTPDAGVTQFTLSVGMTGPGVIIAPGISCGSGGACFNTFAAGTQVSVTATPAPGSTFIHWTAGPCTGSANPVCTFAVTADTNLIASFSVPDAGGGGVDSGVPTPDAGVTSSPLFLTVSGDGHVVSTPAGLDCTKLGGQCQANFNNGSQVTLTASQPAGVQFLGWASGPCAQSTNPVCTFTVVGADNIDASFSSAPADAGTGGPDAGATNFTLNVTAAGNGHLSSSPGAIDCANGAGNCVQSFPAGTAVTLTATNFDPTGTTNWSGACAGTVGNVCTVTMNSNLQVRVDFVAGAPDAGSGGSDAGTGTASLTFDKAFDQNLRAGQTIFANVGVLDVGGSGATVSLDPTTPQWATVANQSMQPDQQTGGIHTFAQLQLSPPQGLVPPGSTASFQITVVASDPSGVSSTQVFAAVVRGNSPPTLTLMGGDNTVYAGDGMALQFAVSDPDGDPVTLQASAPTGQVLVNGTTGVVLWAAPANSFGPGHPITVTATDGVASSAPFTLDVNVLRGIDQTWTQPSAVFSPVAVDKGTQHYALAASPFGLEVYDMTNEAVTPPVVARGRFPRGGKDVALLNNYAFVASGEAGLTVFDVTNPLQPQLVASAFDMNGGAQAVEVSVNPSTQQILLSMSDGSIHIFSLTDVIKGNGSLGWTTLQLPPDANQFPAQPARIGFSGNLAFIPDDAVYGQHDARLFVVDLAAPTGPSIVGTYTPTPRDLGYGDGAVWSGARNAIPFTTGDGHNYVALNEGMAEFVDVIDVTTPSAPTLVGGVRIAGTYLGDMTAQGTSMYLAEDNTNHLWKVDLSDLSALNPPDGGTSTALTQLGSVSAFGAPAFASTGRLYLKVDGQGIASFASNGSAVSPAGVSDQVAPYAFLDGQTNTLFELQAGHLQAYDVSQGIPGTRLGAGLDLGLTAPYTARIAAGGGYAAVVEGSLDATHVIFRTYDVSNPGSPVALGSATVDNTGQLDVNGAPIDTEVLGMTIHGNYAFVAGAEAGVLVFDLSNPATPTFVRALHTVHDVTNPDGGTTSPQEWVNGRVFDTEFDGQFLYVLEANGQNGRRVQVWDLGSPANAATAGYVGQTAVGVGGGAFKVARDGSHNKLYVSSSYANGAQPQVFVFDLTTPSSPQLVEQLNLSNTEDGSFGQMAVGSDQVVLRASSGVQILQKDATNGFLGQGSFVHSTANGGAGNASSPSQPFVYKGDHVLFYGGGLVQTAWLCSDPSGTCPPFVYGQGGPDGGTDGGTGGNNLQVFVQGSGSGTVTSSPPGINCTNGPSACSMSFTPGSQVTLTASPNQGSTFNGWSGGPCAGPSPVCTFTFQGGMTVFANFGGGAPPPQLNVIVNGTGSGNVTSDVGGINCSTGVGGGCFSSSIQPGTQVTLTATVSAGSAFGGWSGVCPDSTSLTCTFTFNGPLSLSATFYNPQTDPGGVVIPVQIGFQGNGTGTVTATNGLLNCSTPNNGCGNSFGEGTVITLNESPGAGSSFGGFNGDCGGPGPSCTFTLSAAHGPYWINATFNGQGGPADGGTGGGVPLQINLTGTGAGSVVSSPPGISCGTGPGTCGGTFPPGTPITLNASPFSGSTFANWDGPCAGQGQTCSFVINGPTTIDANFNGAGTLFFQPVPPQTVAPGASRTLPVSVHDQVGAPVTFSLTTAPPWASLSSPPNVTSNPDGSTDSVVQLTLAPPPNVNPSSFNVQVQASDGQSTAFYNIPVAVQSNQPPMISNIWGDQSQMYSGTALVLKLQINDPDGDPVTVTTSGGAGPVVFNRSTGVLTYFPALGIYGAGHPITVAANDGHATSQYTIDPVIRRGTTQRDQSGWPNWTPAEFDQGASKYLVSGAPGGALEVYDVTNEAVTPPLVGLSDAISVSDVRVVGNDAIVASGLGVLAVDLSDPTHPRLAGQVYDPQNGAGATRVAIAPNGDTWASMNNGQIWVINTAQLVGGNAGYSVIQLPGDAPSGQNANPYGIAFVGNEAFVADDLSWGAQGRLISINMVTHQVDSVVDIPQVDHGDGNLVSGAEGIYAFTQGSSSYVAIAQGGGLAVVTFDVSVPSFPQRLGDAYVPSSGYLSDIRGSGNTAWVFSDIDNHLYQVDLTNPAQPVATALPAFGSYTGVARSNDGTRLYAVFDGRGAGILDLGGNFIQQARPFAGQNAMAFDGTVELSQGAEQLVLTDVSSNPSQILGRLALPLEAPSYAGTVSADSRNGLAAIAWQHDVANSDGVTLALVDVSNPTAPAILGSASNVLSGFVDPRSVSFIPNAQAVVVSAFQGGPLLYDVSNPSAPAMVNRLFVRNSNGANTHAPAFAAVSDGRYVFAIVKDNATGQRVLETYDLGSPANLATAGFLSISSFTLANADTLYLDAAHHRLLTGLNDNAGFSGIVSIDVTNPAAPAVAQKVSVQGAFQARAFGSNGSKLVVLQGNSVVTYDVAPNGDLHNPERISTSEGPGRKLAVFANDAVFSNIDVTHVALCTDPSGTCVAGSNPNEVAGLFASAGSLSSAHVSWAPFPGPLNGLELDVVRTDASAPTMTVRLDPWQNQYDLNLTAGGSYQVTVHTIDQQNHLSAGVSTQLNLGLTGNVFSDFNGNQQAHGLNGNVFALTWNESTLFVALADGAGRSRLQVDGDAIWVGVNTDPATDTQGNPITQVVGNNQVIWPFNTDYVVELKLTGGALAASVFNVQANTWTPQPAAIVRRGNGDELALPRSALGNPGAVRLALVGLNTGNGGSFDLAPVNNNATDVYGFHTSLTSSFGPMGNAWVGDLANSSLAPWISPQGECGVLVSISVNGVNPANGPVQIAGNVAPLDPNIVNSTYGLTDDGMHGDQSPGDGVFTGRFNFGGSNQTLYFEFVQGATEPGFGGGVDRVRTLSFGQPNSDFPTMTFGQVYSATHPFAVTFQVNTGGNPTGIAGNRTELGLAGDGVTWQAGAAAPGTYNGSQFVSTVNFPAQDLTHGNDLQWKVIYDGVNWEGGSNHGTNNDVIDSATLTFNAGDGSYF